MKFLKLFLSIVIILLAQEIPAQENGSLFLSGETIKKYAYSFEVEQPYIELSHPEWFSCKDWKYNPGDDLRWKETTFNDSSWSLFRSDFNLDSISKNEWQGIGWFRLRLIIDSTLFNQQLALVITHFGASEIYFDGKLINRYGQPSKDSAIEKTYRPLYLQPVLLSLDGQSEHLLAVRYSFLQANKLFNQYRKGFLYKYDQPGYAGFMTHFGNSKETIDQFGYSLKKNLLFASITFIALFLIGCFHTSLYLFYSRDRSNLYLAIFNFTIAGFSFTGWLPTYTHLDLQAAMLNELFADIFWCFWLPVSMLAYYGVFFRKLPWYCWLYFIGILLMVYNWFFAFALTFTFQKWLIYIAFIDMLRLFIKSVTKKERNAWILGIGVLLSQSAWIIYLNPSISGYWTHEILEFIAYCILLAVPITLLVFNARRTAEISKNLEKQLVEVKRLSELSLAKEREKQQILTTQKGILEQQVKERTTELSQSLENLQSTQSQLIQSAKMASLGELTAGIAHEIQNPLNFVNNFSEVNTELIVEMQQEMDKGNLDDAKAISNDIKENEQKINHHGKRADAIVKNMLQHSRASSGQKEPTDINTLADEYLRLSYHGIRAKDKNLSATIKTDFDESLSADEAGIGKINIVPQDIGRVLLNLYNNAFYEMNEKKNASLHSPGQAGTAGQSYEPTISVSTKRINDKVEIRVKDNGNGIPQKALDKIFQPFFTTKPTGEGTGLGLSLSYDIVKAHGGEIKVETKDGEGSEFIIQLPMA